MDWLETGCESGVETRGAAPYLGSGSQWLGQPEPPALAGPPGNFAAPPAEYASAPWLRAGGYADGLADGYADLLADGYAVDGFAAPPGLADSSSDNMAWDAAAFNAPFAFDTISPGKLAWDAGFFAGGSEWSQAVRVTGKGSQGTKRLVAAPPMNTNTAGPTPEPKARHRDNGRPDPCVGRDVGKFTSVMVRGLPDKVMRETLTDLLDQGGFKGRYDFVYMPADFQSLVGLGYAFVNFVTPEDARAVQEQFQGVKCPGSTTKIISFAWCDYQGLDVLIERFRNSAIMHEAVPDSAKPIIYRDGARTDFPAPTKTIKMPRYVSYERRAGNLHRRVA